MHFDAHRVTLFIAVSHYGTAAWAGVAYFDATDAGAKRGKRAISAIFAVAAWATLLRLYRSPGESVTQEYAAIAIYASALLIFCWALAVQRGRKLRFAFSTKAPDYFLTDGPYKWVRHPFYSSYILGWIAPTISAPSLPAFAILGLMTFIYCRAAEAEEKEFLRSSFAQVYALYIAATWRFCPKP